MIFSLLTLMDIIGTVAFAIAGAMLAVKKRMDVFGVNMLAIITATGGGMIRDIVIGRIPPVMFRDPTYVFIAAVTANIVFLTFYFHPHLFLSQQILEKLLFWLDTLGLAAFTVDGVFAGIHRGYSGNLFLISFLGVVTGVGGGALSDIFADRMPQIFVKHIYAVASLAGALIVGLLWNRGIPENTCVIGGAACVILLRYFAMKFKWNLPRIPGGE